MNRLSSNEIIQQGRLLLSNFTYWSLDDVEGPDDVFEDDYDSIASLNGVDMPTQNFRNNYSIWESGQSYIQKCIRYFWAKSSSTDSVNSLDFGTGLVDF